MQEGCYAVQDLNERVMRARHHISTNVCSEGSREEHDSHLANSKSKAKVSCGSQLMTWKRLSYWSSGYRWPNARAVRKSGDVRTRSRPPSAWGAESRR